MRAPGCGCFARSVAAGMIPELPRSSPRLVAESALVSASSVELRAEVVRGLVDLPEIVDLVRQIADDPVNFPAHHAQEALVVTDRHEVSRLRGWPSPSEQAERAQDECRCQEVPHVK